MKLTVLLATFNRDEILKATLDGYKCLDIKDIDLQVIVVDNACLKSTESLVESYFELPILYLRNPIPGKNASLNVGLQHVSGQYIVLTDDDAIPAVNWLQKYKSAFLKYPNCSVFGGAIEPHVQESWPKWIDRKNFQIQGAYVIREEPTEDIEVETIFLWGPNMAVKSNVFRNGFRFNEKIGPNGSNYVMGSETELLGRLAKLGHRAMYLKNVRVYHQIRKEQLTWRWLKYRAIRTGKGIANYKIQNDKYDKSVKKLFGLPRYLLAQYVKGWFKLPVVWLFSSRKDFTSFCYNLYWRKGELSFLKSSSRDI